MRFNSNIIMDLYNYFRYKRDASIYLLYFIGKLEVMDWELIKEISETDEQFNLLVILSMGNVIEEKKKRNREIEGFLIEKNRSTRHELNSKISVLHELEVGLITRLINEKEKIIKDKIKISMDEARIKGDKDASAYKVKDSLSELTISANALNGLYTEIDKENQTKGSTHDFLELLFELSREHSFSEDQLDELKVKTNKLFGLFHGKDASVRQCYEHIARPLF